jgi:hypothetical protein
VLPCQFIDLSNLYIDIVKAGFSFTLEDSRATPLEPGPATWPISQSIILCMPFHHCLGFPPCVPGFFSPTAFSTYIYLITVTSSVHTCIFPFKNTARYHICVGANCHVKTLPSLSCSKSALMMVTITGFIFHVLAYR